jgi:hypothetical protein
MGARLNLVQQVDCLNFQHHSLIVCKVVEQAQPGAGQRNGLD